MGGGFYKYVVAASLKDDLQSKIYDSSGDLKEDSLSSLDSPSNIDYSALRSMLFSSDSKETVSYDQCLAITRFLTK
jgi:hypothetical protein